MRGVRSAREGPARARSDPGRVSRARLVVPDDQCIIHEIVEVNASARRSRSAAADYLFRERAEEAGRVQVAKRQPITPHQPPRRRVPHHQPPLAVVQRNDATLYRDEQVVHYLLVALRAAHAEQLLT